MRHDLIGASCRHSGDINLVAALMSMGVPLDKDDPVSLVEKQNGNYASYRFLEHNEEGEPVEKFLVAWNGIAELPPEHGFSAVCRFIRARPRGVQSSTDLLDFAMAYLRERGHEVPGLRCFSDVPYFVNRLPQSEAAYVLAYVWNRDILFQLHRSADRKLYYTEGSGSNTRRAIISTRLPKWQAKELLSRLQG